MSGIAPLDRATRDDLTFVGSAKYAPMLASSKAGAVLISPDHADAEGSVAARIVVAKPQEALLSLIEKLYPPESVEAGIHPTVRLGRGVALGGSVSVGAYTVIGDGVELGDDVVVGSGCHLGAGVRVGSGSRVYPNVTMYPGTSVGSRAIVHAGARLGSDGFGFVQSGGAHVKIRHVGRCVIEDDVEIGANTTIDRGSVDDTVIGAGTKIDNLVHVAHNVRIGRSCLVMAHVGIAGSVRIGDGCILAGQSGVSGHVTIGSGAIIGARAGVISDVPAGETWSGYPARPHREAMRASAALMRLGGMMKRLERLLDGKDGE